MRPPEGPIVRLGTVDSTQAVVSRMLLQGETPGIVVASHQTEGKGRFGRTWVGSEGASLTTSFIFERFIGHRRPWLIGMSIAVAAAMELDCRIQWPNDLVVGERKLGGILTELLPNNQGANVPVVGLGINIGPMEFPADLRDKATMLSQHQESPPSSEDLLIRIVERLDTLPEPENWRDLEPLWMQYDTTPGKLYRMPSGDEAVAIGVGLSGELLCTVRNERKLVMAADALFGA